MAFPSTDLPDPSTWFSNAMITSALMKTNYTDPINLLPRGFLNETNNTGTVTLNAVSDFAGLGPITYTLNSQRRIRIVGQANFSPTAASANARYRIRVGYNTGSSAVVGSFVQVGQPFDVPDTSAQGGSGGCEGTVLLAAGQYTFYSIVRRATGGATTDTASNFYTAIHDVGAT